MGYDDSLDKYMSSFGNPMKAAKKHKKTLGPVMGQLKDYAGYGPQNIGQIMLNQSLASQAAGVGEAQQVGRERAARAFGGGTTTPLDAAMSFQANLGSARPMLEMQAEATGMSALAQIGQQLASLLNSRNQYVIGAGQPYYDDLYAQIAQESLFPPIPAESGGLLGGGFGDILGGL